MAGSTRIPSGRSIVTGFIGVLLFGCTSVEPVNVQAGVFFNQSCPQAHPVYQVPAGKLLIIEDASARAVDAATASIPADPGIVQGQPVTLSLRTNPTGSGPFGSADHIIAAGIGLPVAGGRAMTGYAAPGSEVFFLVGGCTVNLNTQVYFAGRLIDF